MIADQKSRISGIPISWEQQLFARLRTFGRICMPFNQSP